ncbi:MAG: hypothetical protein Q8L36_02390 [bacterium]|nr:hypothetical protein [bacterium]
MAINNKGEAELVELKDERDKFNAVEMIIGGCFTLFIDALALLIDLTGVGLVIAPIIQTIANFVTSWWLKIKGGPNAFKAGRLIAKNIVSLVPILPTNTTAFIIEVWLHNHAPIESLTVIPMKK